MLEMKITGLEDVKRRLSEIGEEIGRTVIDSACRTAALHFAKECKARCRSDIVRSSIKVIRLPGENTPKQFTYLVSAGYNTRVAHLIEFGTKPHEIVPNIEGRIRRNKYRGAAGDERTISVTMQGPSAPGVSGMWRKQRIKVASRGGAFMKVAGRVVLRIQDQYTPRVKEHPGAKDKPFMRPGFDECNQQAIKAFVWRAEREFKRLERAGDIAPQWGGGF